MSRLDRSQGRVQILEGRIIYSPNCQRIVTIPPTSGGTENIFLPIPTRPPISVQESRYTSTIFYNFSTIRLSAYQKPRWWTASYGWASFISCHPEFEGYILGILRRLPRPHELDEHADPLAYSMSAATISKWSTLEGDLYRIAHYLSILTKINIVKPVLPWVFGYKKKHASRSKALYAIERSRDWFVVWIGMVAYLIARAKTMETDLQSYPALSIPKWYNFLITKCCNPTWLDAFSFSDACTYRKATRAGLFVDLTKKGDLQPSIEWFCEFGVPVWYFWDPKYENNPQLEGFAPLSHQLQAATTTISSHLSSTPQSQLHDSPAQSHITWQDFFIRRDARNKQLLANEKPQQRKSREDRERNPPKQSAKVFIWVEDMSGHLVREMVSSRERRETLETYSKDQIRYDSFSNEYDCCEAFGSGEGYNALDYFESGEEILEIEVDAHDIAQDSGLLNHPAQQFSLPCDRELSVSLPDYNDHQGCLIDRAECEILEILFLHFGYTPPIPPPAGNPVAAEGDQKNFLKILGITWKSVPRETFERPRIIAAATFMVRFCQKGVLSDDEWDLRRNHRESMVFSKRIKCIHQVKHVSTTQAFYMFDFGSDSTKDWKIAVTSAADAVMVCRVDLRYTETDIALFLLQHGIPFRTLKLSSTLPRSHFPDNQSIEYPYRPSGFKFDIDDYAVYIDRSIQLLKSPTGRVALMKGGYLWRIAVPHVSFETVLIGPNGQGDLFSVTSENGQTYVDDEMTQHDADILSGLYYCATGEGAQIAKKSWYPPPIIYQHSGLDYGRWSSNSEQIFDIVNKRNSSASQGATTMQRQPQASNKWRDALRGSGDLRRARVRLEDAARDLISGEN